MDVRNLTRPAVVGIRQAGQPVSGTTPAANDRHTDGNGLRTLAAAIDDWLGPEVLADRRAAIHAAFHGVVSTPFLLLDHSAMTPELVQAMPLAVWKALADMGLEQGCAINSVCFPAGMRFCPDGLLQLGALAYIELPAYDSSIIDLRDLRTANNFHLSLQGSRKAKTVFAKNFASICVTANVNALDLVYYDNFGMRKKTVHLAAQARLIPVGFIEAPKLAFVPHRDVPQKKPLQLTLESASVPHLVGEPVSDTRIERMLAPIRELLGQAITEEEKIKSATVVSSQALENFADAFLRKDQEVMQSFFQLLASAMVSNEFRFKALNFVLNRVSMSLDEKKYSSSCFEIARFIVGQLLDAKIDERLKFRLVRGEYRENLGLSGALSKNDHHTLALILEALTKSSLRDEDILAMLMFDGEPKNQLQDAIEKGNIASVTVFMNAVLRSPRWSFHANSIFRNSRPALFKHDDLFKKSADVDRAKVKFTMSVLSFHTITYEIEYLTCLRIDKLRAGDVVPTNLAQSFFNLVWVGDEEYISQYFDAVYHSRLSDQNKIRLLVDGSMHVDPYKPKNLLCGPYITGWTLFMKKLFFSGFSDQMKFEIVRQSKKQWRPGLNYRELFSQIAVANAEVPKAKLDDLFETVNILLALPENFENLDGASLGKSVLVLNDTLHHPRLTSTRKMEVLHDAIRVGLVSSQSCLAVTRLILGSPLPDHLKLKLFEAPDSHSSSFPASLQSNRQVVSGYLNTVLESSLSATDMVALINLSDWSTDRAIMSGFAKCILSSTLAWQNMRVILDHQIENGTIFDKDGGISILQAVLNSNLDGEIKFQIITARHYFGWKLGLCVLHKPESVKSHLALLLESSLELEQMVEICRAADLPKGDYLCSLFSRISQIVSQIQRPGETKAISAKTEKARMYMETILASSLPDLSKFELMAATNRRKFMAIDHLVNGGAAHTVAMYNTTIENSTLPASMKQKLMRKGDGQMQ